MVAKELAPLVVITGETASGKSQLAMELAERFNGEIICADSWTVYKGFDIGTAKPSASDRASIQHHLLDITTADKGFSAPEFQLLALDAIGDISARGKLAIMVGGTGLYIDSVIYNYSFLPPGSATDRARLNSLTLSELISIASERELSLHNIDTRNKRRVVRLIENDGQSPTRSEIRGNTLLLGLAIQRGQLMARVESRVDTMLSAGLEREVRSLVSQYGWANEPMKGVGYSQWRGYLDGSQTLEETRAKIIKATMDLAKKQRTWFNRNKSIHWLSDRSKVTQAVELTTTFLNK